MSIPNKTRRWKTNTGSKTWRLNNICTHSWDFGHCLQNCPRNLKIEGKTLSTRCETLFSWLTLVDSGPWSTNTFIGTFKTDVMLREKNEGSCLLIQKTERQFGKHDLNHKLCTHSWDFGTFVLSPAGQKTNERPTNTHWDNNKRWGAKWCMMPKTKCMYHVFTRGKVCEYFVKWPFYFINCWSDRYLVNRKASWWQNGEAK